MIRSSSPAQPSIPRCRICGEAVAEFLDLGTQPLSDSFPREGEAAHEFSYRLAVGRCSGCAMVQLVEEVPRERMFNEDYPYFSAGSSVMRAHFATTARSFLNRLGAADDPFVVEIGCNDGVMLGTVRDAGVRHLGFEPSGSVAAVARAKGIQVREAFFEAATASAARKEHGPADVIFAANTLCHIPYMDSILEGVRELLAPDGVFVFEDPYLGDIVAQSSFDQIYDEHYFLFCATSVRTMARRFGLELVEVERLPVHGGEVRYTLARQGTRSPSGAVAALLAEEEDRQLANLETLRRFADTVFTVRDDLTSLLRRLRDEGRTVVAYGATAKSATVTNFCGIGPDLVTRVYDTTPAKQGRLTPGAHIPVVPADRFADDRPDYAVLFAWNHAEEIMANEQAFRDAVGKWVLYVPDVRVI
jgi:methylation protein EvaC